MKKNSILAAAALLVTASSASLAATPEIWFCPLDALPRTGPGYNGVPQYMDLFKPDAPWQKAASHVKVFKIYHLWARKAPSADLKKQFAWIKAHGMELALEAGVLSSETAADKNTEGFFGEDLLMLVRRIEENGGDLKYVSMDEPLILTLDVGKRPARMSVQQIVDNAVKNMQAVQAAYPKIRFGDIEPIGLGELKPTLEHYTEGWKAFAAAGVPLAFFNADLDWTRAGVLGYLKAFRDAARDQKLPFGVIYDGNPQDSSDAAWLKVAKDHAEATEATIGVPDSVIFQTWHPFPVKLLPEQDPDSFTHLIDVYCRPHAKLTTDAIGSSLSGKLVTENGMPIANAPVKVSIRPAVGSDRISTLSATGVIPPGTDSLSFSVRASEVGWTGGSMIQIKEYKVQTKDGWSASQSFQDPAILNSWGGLGIGDDGRTTLRGDTLCVTPASTVYLEYNSSRLPVPAAQVGQPFTFTVQAQVPPEAADAGTFGLFFLNATGETLRSIISFSPTSTPVGTAKTRADGTWSISLPEGKNLNVEAKFDGGEKYWPAESLMTVKGD